MSEEIEKSADGHVDTAAVDGVVEPVILPEPVVEERLPSAGEQLRAAREAQGMSVLEVAQALMLAARQVEAIENDDWTKLPGDTFARGFIRNYARLVKLDSEALLRRNAEQRAAAAAPNIELPQALEAEIPQASHAKKRDKVTIFAAAAMVVVAFLVYFLLPENLLAPKAEQTALTAPAAETVVAPATPAEAAPASSGMAAPAPMVVATPAEVPPVAAPVTPAAAAPVVPAKAAPVPPVAAVASVPAVAPPAAPAKPTATPSAAPAVAGSVHLKFNFAQDSWVEVTDKTGQKLISSKNLGGSQREAVGVPPLTVIIGNATHVKLSADGKPIDLAPRSKDDVARLIVQ